MGTPAPMGLVLRLVPLLALAAAPSPRDHRYNAGWYQEGELFDVDPEVTLVFRVEGGRAPGFALHGRDQVMGRGERTGDR